MWYTTDRNSVTSSRTERTVVEMSILALLALDVVDPYNVLIFSESPRVPSGHKMPSVSLPPRLVENNVFHVIRKS